jgi:voltage-gated potassium channel
MLKNRLQIALLICISITTLGTIGYMTIENYSFFDALYMAIITITTVGYSEINPLSTQGRIFTIFLILVGFSSLAYTGSVVAESLLENVWKNKRGKGKMQKRINELTGHYIICGLGRVGRASATHFAEKGHSFIIIEQDKEICKTALNDKFLCINGDATQEDVLLKAGIKKAKGLLALLHTDPLNLFTVLTARELNPTLQITARSVETSADSKILKAGADTVISPYTTAGRHFAEKILSSTGNLTADQPTEQAKPVCNWVTIKDGSSMEGKTIAAISDQMQREIIGLRRAEKDILSPDQNITLTTGDKILILDIKQENNQWDEKQTAPKKIVIIDDNPVIIRLYSRLFQKAGFHPLTAMDGQSGLDLILAEKPAIAVVDYQMPGLSGIEICKKVKTALPDDSTKLILFTADEREETKQKALQAGACHVITKSPEASEIIEIVKHYS